MKIVDIPAGCITSGVYSIICTINGKRYVGGSKNLMKRRQGHLARLRRNSHHAFELQNDWNLYGPEAFIFILVEEVANVNSLVSHEQAWMDFYKSYTELGYNIEPTAGSSRGRKSTAETKAKISANNMGHEVSLETRAKISAKRATFVYSDEMRKNMSEGAKRRGPHGKETYVKIAKAITGQKRTDETRTNISKAKIGKPLSESHKEALKKAWENRKLKYPDTSRHSKPKET